jgi:beta-galactosidase
MLIHFDSVSKESASGNARVHVQNLSSETRNFSIHISFELNNQKFAFVSEKIALASQNQQIQNIPLQIQNPELWHPNHPNLYNVTISVVENNQTIDEEKFTQGIRHFNLKKDGFYVNHEKYFLQGTNRHQEYPYIGYALSDEAQMRDAVLIKNAGFDFVRLSHYPHSEAFMQACDELGLITMNCISGWQYYGDATFVKNSIEEIKSLARRDRNRASVAFWEVSLNESDMSESYMKQANETLKKELPFKNIYTAGWMDHSSYDLYIPARQHGKAPMYWNNYQKDNRKIIIAEYGDWEYYAQNAGFNQTEFSNLKEEERTSRQLRAFGEKRLLQQAFNFQEAANSNMKGVHTIGHANWLMFDYNRGYSDDLESSGISDIFRIPKFAYYFYQSQRDPKIKLENTITSGTMVHIASYWTEKSPLDVKIYSNASEVKLTLNGKEIGIQKAVRDTYSDALPHPPFIFKIPKFEAGILKAEAILDGKVVATHEVHTPEKAMKIELSAATQNIPISSKNKDVWFVYAKLTDINNQLCVDQTDLVKLNIQQGNAQIIGPTSINAEAGIATFLIESQPDTQTLILEVSSEGLKKSTLEIKR